MSQAEEYLDLADKYEAEAVRLVWPYLREQYLRLADEYRRLADQARKKPPGR